jgi:hypothetical protein
MACTIIANQSARRHVTKGSKEELIIRMFTFNDHPCPGRARYIFRPICDCHDDEIVAVFKQSSD